MCKMLADGDRGSPSYSTHLRYPSRRIEDRTVSCGSECKGSTSRAAVAPLSNRCFEGRAADETAKKTFFQKKYRVGPDRDGRSLVEIGSGEDVESERRPIKAVRQFHIQPQEKHR